MASLLDFDSPSPGNSPIIVPEPKVQADIWRDVVRPLVPRSKRNGLTRPERAKLGEDLAAIPLNPAQREFVNHRGGPILALSGAGTGKTKAVECLVAGLTSEGVRPGRIGLFTFSKKAAKEAEFRCRRMLRPYTDGLPYARTLHSYAYGLLIKHAKELNYKNGIRVIPNMYKRQFLARGLAELPADVREEIGGDPLKAIAEAISTLKKQGIGPLEARERGILVAEPYVTIQSLMQQTGFIDFDDQLRLANALFEKTERRNQILARERRDFDFIIIDEYQDTNPMQERLIAHIAGGHRRLYVVGDDDQSIYGFAGAEVDIIRKMPERWPGAKVVQFDINYRSTGLLLEAANKLVAKSKEERYDKVLKSCKGPGEQPTPRAFRDEFGEAEWIAHDIKEKGYEPKDVMILVNDPFTTRFCVVEEALANAKIPYVDHFRTEMEMGPTKTNAYSMLAAIHDPTEEPALMNIFSCPAVKLNENDFSEMMRLRNKGERPLWTILTEDELGSFERDTRENLRLMAQVINELHRRARSPGRNEGLYQIAFEGFQWMYPGATKPELWNDPKTYNDDTISLRTITTRVAGFENKAKAYQRTLAAYLNFQLVEIPRRIKEGKTKRKANEEVNAVYCGTIHGAKGLERKVVYLPRFVEGSIPHWRSIPLSDHNEGEDDQPYLFDTSETSKELEEARRLGYVGVTRAQDVLNISFPVRMTLNRTSVVRHPSRFLHDMELMQFLDSSAT